MKKITLLILCLGTFTYAASSRFILLSELKSNHTGTSTSAYTRYSHDASGNRLLKRVYDGIDTNASKLSTLSYSYLPSGLLSSEVLLDTSGDTISIVRYTYTVNTLVCATVLSKAGSLKFKDTLIYEGAFLKRQNRIISSGITSFYHAYTYTTMLLSADTLYETDGAGGYAAAQARNMTYNSDNTVATETQSHWSGTSWFPTATIRMGYQFSHLYSVTTYEIDGSSNKMVDSLSYNYDSYGTRVREYKYDNNHIMLYDIMYTWYDTFPTSISLLPHEAPGSQAIVLKNSSIRFSTPFTGTVRICSLDGKTITSLWCNTTNELALPYNFSKGKYLLTFSGTIFHAILR